VFTCWSVVVWYKKFVCKMYEPMFWIEHFSFLLSLFLQFLSPSQCFELSIFHSFFLCFCNFFLRANVLNWAFFIPSFSAISFSTATLMIWDFFCGFWNWLNYLFYLFLQLFFLSFRAHWGIQWKRLNNLPMGYSMTKIE